MASKTVYLMSQINSIDKNHVWPNYYVKVIGFQLVQLRDWSVDWPKSDFGSSLA